jgi:hypothetical protein
MNYIDQDNGIYGIVGTKYNITGIPNYGKPESLE